MNVNFIKGSTITFFFLLLSDDTAIDITGSTITMIVKRRPTDADNKALLTKTIGSGVTIVEPLEGTFEVLFDADDTIDVDRETLYFENVIELSDGSIVRNGVNTFTMLDVLKHGL